MKAFVTFAAVAIAAAALGGCGKPQASGNPTLKFSILSAESEAKMAPVWQPLIDDMSKQVGVPVQPFFATNYTSLIEAMRFNQVQVGWFSALPSLEATRRAHGEVIDRVVLADGRDSYKSVLIVKKGSGITLDKVLACGKKYDFGLGDPKSTSGTLAPTTYLFAPRNIDPTTCFKTVRSASHESNAFAVAKGVLDVGTNNSVGLIFYGRNDPQMRDDLQVIWESPPLPESSIIARSDLDPALKEKIRQFFLNYGQGAGPEKEHERQVLKALEYARFEPATDDYLDPVREMEATQNLIEARQAKDDAKAAAAQKVLDALAAKRAKAAPAQS